MSDHEPVPPPPPPPSSAPPPPPYAAPPQTPGPEPSGDVRKDNPIAVAALVVATLGLITSVIVIGGFIAIIAIVMSGVALRRSKIAGQGRGLAITALVIAAISMIAAAIALTIIVATVRGEDVVRNGVVSSSDNTEFPPQDDIIEVECTEEGNNPLAVITIENFSLEDSSYTLTITWDVETEAGTEEISEILRSPEFLPAGEQTQFRLFQRAAGTVTDSCAVSRIERTSFVLGG